MKPNPGPGKFIVIEGLDGAGTTTQSHLLGERLGKQGPIWVTWEPSERPVGLLIRRVLKGELLTDPRALALLFAADRLDHLYGMDGVMAHLGRGETVVCDRYYLSSLAYQTLDAPFSWVYQLNSRALRPDLTLFLEVPVRLCLERIGGRPGGQQDIFEREEALEHVRASYARALRYLGRSEFHLAVDGCGPIAYVADLAWQRVQALFDAGLVTDPRAQRSLARRARLPAVRRFQELLLAEPGLFLRGLRRAEGAVAAEVDTLETRRPLVVRFAAGEAAVYAGEGDAALARDAARLERLALRALQEAGRG